MKLILLDAAEQETMRAAERYEQETPGLGTEFLHAIASAASLLCRQRFLGRIFTGIDLLDAREYVMPRFPYSLIYRVGETSLTVVAVSHQHRRRGYWRNRVQEEPAEYLLAA
jgi:plasmid stabilization system protein ParE